MKVLLPHGAAVGAGTMAKAQVLPATRGSPTTITRVAAPAVGMEPLTMVLLGLPVPEKPHHLSQRSGDGDGAGLSTMLTGLPALQLPTWL